MKTLEYSIVPFEYYNPSWVQANGRDWWWVRIKTQSDKGWGITQIGPYRREVAEEYIRSVAYPIKKGFWKRLFGK